MRILRRSEFYFSMLFVLFPLFRVDIFVVNWKLISPLYNEQMKRKKNAFKFLLRDKLLASVFTDVLLEATNFKRKVRVKEGLSCSLLWFGRMNCYFQFSDKILLFFLQVSLKFEIRVGNCLKVIDLGYEFILFIDLLQSIDKRTRK